MNLRASLLLLSIAAPGETLVWTPQESGCEASLRGLCAVNERVCWASGADGTILRTVDGVHWERCAIPGDESLDWRDIHAFDAETAVVVSAGQPARICRTKDGGASWARAFEHDDEAAFFDGMAFWDEQRGLAFSDPIDGRVAVVVTEDGGRSWRSVEPGALPLSPEGEAGFAASGSSLRVRGSAEAWIGLGGPHGARVLRTRDGGASWTAARTPVLSETKSTGIYSLAIGPRDRLIAVGGDYTREDLRRANIAVSDDGGASWCATGGAPPGGYRSCVELLAGRPGPTLVAVGPTGSDVSTDGGDSWRRFSELGFHAVSCAPDGTAWAAGAGGRLARLDRSRGRRAAWNGFRGPNGTGVAQGGPFPQALGPQTNVIWERPLAAGRSSPVLTRDLVVLTGVAEERLFTYALDRETGETRWRREAPRPRRTSFHSKNGPAAASATAGEETIVVFFDEFGVLAYDHDGAERWRVPMGPFVNIYGMGASPILHEGAVVIACDQTRGSFVVALAEEDGRELWRQERPRAVSGHCTPALYTRAGADTEVLVAGSFQLDAYDLTTGERRWWVNGLPAEMKSVPVVLNDTVWVHGYSLPLNDHGNQIELAAFARAVGEMDANGDGQLSADEISEPKVADSFRFIDLDGDGGLDAHEWELTRAFFTSANCAMAIRLGGSGDLTASGVRWRAYRSPPQLPSPLVHGGVYYMLSDQGGLLTLIDPDTGERFGRERLAEGIDDYFASPVAADDKVYLLSESGILSVLKCGRELAVLHRAEFGELCHATPALEDGRIWLRTRERLFCFGIR